MTTTSDVPDAATLMARATSLRPLLERNADRTDAQRRLPDEVVQALKETGLCALMVPKRFGGYQTSVRTYIDVMSELGRGCGSTAWVASLINVCAWLAALFPERAQRDIWESDPDAWVAGSLAPNGTAVPVDGGWRVTGRWPWASGSLHAQWGACGIHMKNERGEMANFGLSLMPMSQLTIEDTWFMVGMKGTGSNTIVAKDVFVPEHRFLPYPQAFAGSYRTEFKRRSRLSRRSGAGDGADSRGLTDRRGACCARTRGGEVAHARHHAHQLRDTGGVGRLSDAGGRRGDEDRHSRAPRAASGGRSRSRVASRARHMDLTERARVRIDTALVAKYCREAVEVLVAAHGTSSLADANRLQRLWRDVHTASHHAITEWQVNLEVYGKALLGVEPNITHLI